MATENTPRFSPETRYNGQVKWFNNKAGYGFITMNVRDETHDIFVHHSSLSVSNEQYKYLVQGEYVEFNIGRLVNENATHEWQATDVTGFNRGSLMCETRYNTRRTYRDDSTENTDRPRTQYQRRRPLNHGQTQQDGTVQDTRQYSRPPRLSHDIPVRFYGQGPRSGGGEQWLLVPSTAVQRPPRQYGQQRRRSYVQQEHSSTYQ